MTAAKADAAPRRNTWLFLIPIFFLAIALLLAWGFTRDASLVPSVMIGKPAPALSLAALPGVELDGKPLPGLGNADLRGQGVTVINVFASWCTPCRDEHPALMKFAATGKARMVAINYKDNPANAASVLAELGNPYSAIGVDANGRTAIDWGVYGVPETFIVANDGMIVDKITGPISTEETYATLEAAVARASAGQRSP